MSLSTKLIQLDGRSQSGVEAPALTAGAILQSPVRPRFFHGQLLTDADLSAGLEWTQNRLGLGCYRDGWGVVRGLDVRVAPAPERRQQPGHVVVGPGYAVSCRGHDIVVAEQSRPYDLSDICHTSDESCAKLSRRETAAGAAPDLHFGGHIVPGDQVCAVDLFIRYAEEPFDLQPALGRSAWSSGSSSASVCEQARVRETYQLDARRAGEDALVPAADRWHAGYAACLDDVLNAYNKHGRVMPVRTEAQTKAQWLQDWIDMNPLQVFRFAEDEIRALRAAAPEKEIARALFWIVQDRRVTYLNSFRSACAGDQGVPLARIWLAPANGNWQITAIDHAPPFRRLYSPDAWPAPLGKVNLGQFIGRRWAEVRRELAGLGLPVHQPQERLQIPVTVAELKQTLHCCPPESGKQPRGAQTCFLFADGTTEVHVQIFEVAAPDKFDQRVIGLGPLPAAGATRETAQEGA